MNRLIFLTFGLLACCSSPDKKININFDFTDDMSIKDFEIKLEEYAKNSKYPDIDNLNE